MIRRVVGRYPTLAAAVIYAVSVAAAFHRFFGGGFLVNEMSDARTGFAPRLFAARYFEALGDVPGWSPGLFGGMPFLANTAHGDTFYPTFLLRLIFPVDVGITLGFLIHIVLAGVFAFMFLRALKLDWGPAFIGGAAYMWSGQIVSLVSPGHDGKLFVSALLPLALMFLYQAVTRSSWQRYLAFGATVGFALISPHFQMTYYLLMAAGFFWVFLVFLSGERPAATPWWRATALFVVALAVGFALAAVQLMPFAEYIAFSPRGAAEGASRGWDYATGWSMPPEELINAVWPAFSGILRDYWGRNPFKLHSEYVGIVTLMLATFAFSLKDRRRLSWFFVFLAVYGVLFAFGGYTPFYRLPYHLLPGIKLTRAASMIFFLASFGAAVLAALGAQALLAGDDHAKRRRVALIWVGVAAGAVLLAFAGVWRGVMDAVAAPERFGGVAANYQSFQLDAARVAVFAALAAGLLWKRLPQPVWTLALGLVVMLELWSVERHYIQWSPPASQLFAADPVVENVRANGRPSRILALSGAYQGKNYFMIHGVREVLGYSGQELHRYDELLGGKNIWSNLFAFNENLLKILAVEYIALDQPLEDPRLSPVDGAGAGQGTGEPLTALGGQPVYLYRYANAAPFAFPVGGAIKVPDPQIIPALLDPRFDPTRLLLVPDDAQVGSTALDSLPPPVPASVTVEERHPGAFSLTLDPAPRDSAYVFIAENYFPDWRARVDDQEAPVLRAQYTMMAVPVPAGAKRVDLEFRSAAYRKGRVVTLVVLLGLGGIGLWQAALSRRRNGGAPDG